MLKAPEQLQYQIAFLTDELREIFAAAPLPAFDPASGLPDGTADSNRKAIEGDCSICFMEFLPKEEEIVYCKAACGNNIHQSCFEVRDFSFIFPLVDWYTHSYNTCSTNGEVPKSVHSCFTARYTDSENLAFLAMG